MITIDSFVPTRIVFGAGRLAELVSVDLPGKRALICTTKSARAEHLSLIENVVKMLAEAGVESVVFDGVGANPTKDQVDAACELAKSSSSDFIIGLGGGSSIDLAKAVAFLLCEGGDLWDYAYTGTGGRKEVTKALPIVAITTTAGTGTEADPYSVITNTETGEKLDFAAEPLFPVLSIIDPELMMTLPRDLSIYQGLDALFHASECLITNRGENLLVDAYANESITSVVHYLPQVVEDPNNLEARTRVSYAANICSGYTQSLIGTTSHHIIAQTIGGMFPNVPHGAALVMIAEEYYRKISTLATPELNRLAAYFGIESSDGLGWSLGLGKFFEKLGVRHLPMSAYGITREDLPQIADYTVNRTGISDIDNYTLTVEDVQEILEKSYC